ncbi:hypothetical protein FACI_IFERC00001G0030 [Ferroplasma acidarmanus Fer1]|uniref:Uncharacterized protein n=4 Tax=Ferroplasmaceae TaxID=90142 RepID=S0APM6_FERAC|nr:hypothetical protein FACI_IFERC00001G0030 [Ferroplasma acidarmanus Fer1]
MKLQNEPDPMIEKELVIRRLWNIYSFTGFNDFAEYVKNTYPGFIITPDINSKLKDNNNLNMLEAEKLIKSAAYAIPSFEDFKTIINNAPPRAKEEGQDFDLPFTGYYINIDAKWNIKLESKWQELYTELNKSLNKKKPNFTGIKTYAVLKALFSNYTNDGTYEISTIKLVTEANSMLNQNQEIRVWYNNFNDLIGAGILYNTRSNKYGQMTILPETMPLIKLILNEYEQSNVRELNEVKNGRLPY